MGKKISLPADQLKNQ